MRDRNDRPRHRILIGFLLLILVAAGCNSAAAQRLKDASRIIAQRIGSSAEEVEQTFKSRFTTLNEVQLADEAEGAVQRTTWVDQALAKLAADRLKTAKAVQRSTCKLIDGFAVLSQLSDADQASEVQSIIVSELQKQGLSDDEDSINSVADAMITQIDSLQANGSLDLQSMSSDLFCFLEL